MIDGLVSQCGQRLIELWKRDEGGTGLYPPPSLHVSEDYKMWCFLKKTMPQVYSIVLFLLTGLA